MTNPQESSVTYKVCQIEHQGVKLILIPFIDDVDKANEKNADKLILLAKFEKSAASEGLAGAVGFVWPRPNGTTNYFPTNIRELGNYARATPFDVIKKSCNKTLRLAF